MRINGVLIEDTFAEAFPMRAARIVITAVNQRWAREAALKLTGFATSVIACKCEAAIEGELAPDETPDGRPGISALLFAMDTESLGKRLIERIGQTVLTCPTANCFDGLPNETRRLTAGRALRVFGDGFQASKVVGERRYWRIPVMDGECVIEESFGAAKGIGGGNFLILGADADSTLAAAEAAASAIENTSGVILPFPGGVVRSGSKVGSRRYASVPASTNDAYCPTLRPVTDSALPDDVHSVLELVLDGLDEASINAAMRAGIAAACRAGIRAISAGNFGGKLGPHHFRLRDIMAGSGDGAPS
ncbi:MAG TPA: formylmethanofuran--tetrahydromethanopterin N-formyltransferase [Gemmatimonadaceae bacterium]|nr:formylmethanofuran--tetrahydromethanopterin N-formyltransferase [Gemmatimonadaceae bacterium]